MAKQPEAMRMMGRGEGKDDETPHMEDTPAYAALMSGGLINNSYRRTNVEDIFTGSDLRANSSKDNDLKVRCMYCYYIPPFCGACLYNCTHTELFVPAGFGACRERAPRLSRRGTRSTHTHTMRVTRARARARALLARAVGLLMNESNEYLFAQPGMHNISSVFLRVASEPVKLRGHIKHGNRTITIIEQGYVGYAQDNGQPVLLPPGIHVWTSESMDFLMAYPLNDHIVRLGPYTLITVDEGYAAVTQNNGKQAVLKGGHTHLLNHKNWKFEARARARARARGESARARSFENSRGRCARLGAPPHSHARSSPLRAARQKFMTLKIQTDDLEKIQATSADNINMMVNSTVNWRIVDVEIAATMAAETMAISGRVEDVTADISKLRRDVLKQALASLAAFIGGVNYSESFHMSAAAQNKPKPPPMAEATLVDGAPPADATPVSKGFADNPLYDIDKMGSAVAHANRVTQTCVAHTRAHATAAAARSLRARPARAARVLARLRARGVTESTALLRRPSGYMQVRYRGDEHQHHLGVPVRRGAHQVARVGRGRERRGAPGRDGRARPGERGQDPGGGRSDAL